MKYDAHLKETETGRAVLSSSGCTLCHFNLNLKLIVFFQSESLDDTQNDSSSLLLGTVLGDLTPGTQIQNDICPKTQPFER